MNVNIALLTVTDTRTFENDKSGAILVKKIEEKWINNDFKVSEKEVSQVVEN